MCKTGAEKRQRVFVCEIQGRGGRAGERLFDNFRAARGAASQEAAGKCSARRPSTLQNNAPPRSPPTEVASLWSWSTQVQAVGVGSTQSWGHW